MKKITAIILFGTFILIMIGMFGCNLQKRQVRQLDGLVLQQPAEFARLSNLLNPCFSGKAKSDTVIVKGKPDTVLLAGRSDTLRKKDTLIITKTLPGKLITVPVTKIIHDTIADQRALAVINNNLKIKSDSLIIEKTNNGNLKSAKNTLLYWVIGLAAALVTVIGISVYKLFTGGFVKKVVSDV